MSSEYNLTENQKELARRIVQDIRNGILEEEFRFDWVEGGTVLLGPTGADPNHIIVTRGNVQELCDEGMLRLLWESGGGVGVAVKGRLYEAVESNFGAKVEPEHPQAETPDSTEIEIFISHNSEDKDIVELLIDLLKDALSLNIENILATSVPGHGFPAGVSIEDHVIKNTAEAKVMIALLTPNSLASTWVLIEIGARLATRKPIFPLLAKGTTVDDVKEPLQSRTMLDSSSENDLHKLVGDLAEILNRKLRSGEKYRRHVSKIVDLRKGGLDYSRLEGTYDHYYSKGKVEGNRSDITFEPPNVLSIVSKLKSGWVWKGKVVMNKLVHVSGS